VCGAAWALLFKTNGKTNKEMIKTNTAKRFSIVLLDFPINENKLSSVSQF